MDEDRFPDASRDPEPSGSDRSGDVNHLAYILLAVIVMLIFWYAG